jgi:hypothetical protein
MIRMDSCGPGPPSPQAPAFVGAGIPGPMCPQGLGPGTSGPMAMVSTNVRPLENEAISSGWFRTNACFDLGAFKTIRQASGVGSDTD